MDQADELVAMDDEALTGEACILVDHREEEESIVEYFAEKLPDEGLEPFWRDDQLWFRHAGAEYRIPLTESPVDRYVAIDSLATVLAGKYEIRLHLPTLEDDTHALLVLPHATWAELERRHPAWVGANFRPLELGKDYFGGGEIPYLKIG